MTPLRGLVWDACTTINLIATGCANEILTALGNVSYIVNKVRVREVICLRRYPAPKDGSRGEPFQIDLLPLIEANILQELELTPAEGATFLTFTDRVHDGEARWTAVAVHRNLMLVTDDKDSIRLARGLMPPVAVLTTLDWMKRWVDEHAVDDDRLGRVLHRVEVSAHFKPPRSHPLKSWWEAHFRGRPG